MNGGGDDEFDSVHFTGPCVCVRCIGFRLSASCDASVSLIGLHRLQPGFGIGRPVRAGSGGNRCGGFPRGLLRYSLSAMGCVSPYPTAEKLEVGTRRPRSSFRMDWARPLAQLLVHLFTALTVGMALNFQIGSGRIPAGCQRSDSMHRAIQMQRSPIRARTRSCCQPALRRSALRRLSGSGRMHLRVPVVVPRHR